MIRKALKLEWLKMRHYRVFWILLGLYLVALLVLCVGTMIFFNALANNGVKFDQLDPTIIPFYDFPDVWHNNTYLGHFIKILLAFIVVISITNDWTYLTMRQNIIDGLSKREFVVSKILLILGLAAISTVFLSVVSFVMGLVYSNTLAIDDILEDTEFLFLYFLDIVRYCLFAFFVTVLIRRPGFVIVFLIFYSLIIEPIVGGILKYKPGLSESTAWITPLLPSNYFHAIDGLIQVPFQRYALREIQEGIDWKFTVIALVWCAIFVFLIYRTLVKKDIR